MLETITPLLTFLEPAFWDTDLRLISDDERNTFYDIIKDEEGNESGSCAKIFLPKDEVYIVSDLRYMTDHHDVNKMRMV